MKAFTDYSGIAAPLLRINIDTDTIIPSTEMKRVSKHGLSEGLFAGWRYLYDNNEKQGNNSDFILNKPDYVGASILLTGSNFGCGSSREHAVWALTEYGFRVIIAPSFGSIFYNNAVRNGLLPVELPEENITELAEYCMESPAANHININLANTKVSSNAGDEFHFDIEPVHKEMLLQGLDSIDMTLKHINDIEKFQSRDKQQRSWAYL